MAVKPNMKVSDEDFIRLWYEHKSAVKISERTGLDIRNVYARRRYIENKYKIRLASKNSRIPEFYVRDHMSRMDVDLDNAVIFVASDAHYWPDEISTAHQAFVKLVKKHKPDIIVMNGDAFDGASISRYPKAGYETFKMPTVKQELEAVSDRLGEIEKVAGNAKLVFTMGNHDQRFE